MRRVAGSRGLVGMAVLAVLLLSGTAAFADLTGAPGMAGINRPFNARVWGMGGACTAVANDADALLANPAGVPFMEGSKASLGFVKQTLATSMEMYGGTETFSGDFSLWGLAWAKGTEPDDLQQGKRSGGGMTLSGGDVNPWGLDWTQFTFGGGSGTRNFAWGVTSDIWGFGEGIESELTAGVGALYRSDGGFSLGLNWDNAFTTLEDIDFSCLSVGAAYERSGLTLAADLFNLTDTDLIEDSELLLGAEYCFENGFAVRGGSANGNLSYGLGYQGRNWSLDYAYVAADESAVLVPDLTLSVEDEYHFLSLSFLWGSEAIPEDEEESVPTVEVQPVEEKPSDWKPKTEW
jgi:hypothetical protein